MLTTPERHHLETSFYIFLAPNFPWHLLFKVFVHEVYFCTHFHVGPFCYLSLQVAFLLLILCLISLQTFATQFLFHWISVFVLLFFWIFQWSHMGRCVLSLPPPPFSPQRAKPGDLCVRRLFGRVLTTAYQQSVGSAGAAWVESWMTLLP